MNYKILIIFFLFLHSCETRVSNIEYKNLKNYSNKGFALIYSKDLYKKKIISKKINERSLIVFNHNLNIDTQVKITNLLNNKYLFAQVGKKAEFPIFYNSVISQRIAKDLAIDPNEPYIKIQTLNSNNSFIANKAKTYDEERTVADKAPVSGIIIKNIGINNDNPKKEEENKINNFKYIIKIADLFFEDSAIMLKKRLTKEFNFKNVYIKKLTENSFRVYKGPFEDLDSIKKEFNDINKLNFENIEIIKL